MKKDGGERAYTIPIEVFDCDANLRDVWKFSLCAITADCKTTAIVDLIEDSEFGRRFRFRPGRVREVPKCDFPYATPKGVIIPPAEYQEFTPLDL